MVLSQPDLRKEIEGGRIIFDPPLEENQWGEASVDLRLGYKFTKLKDDVKGLTISVADGLRSVGEGGLWNDRVLKSKNEFGEPETCELGPDDFRLAMTLERVTVPRHLIARVEGRSTYARVGLSMHQTAPWIQPGWVGPIVLEMMNSGPFNIKLTPVVDLPCQLTFFTLSTELPSDLAYGGRETDVYQRQTHPIKR